MLCTQFARRLCTCHNLVSDETCGANTTIPTMLCWYLITIIILSPHGNMLPSAICIRKLQIQKSYLVFLYTLGTFKIQIYFARLIIRFKQSLFLADLKRLMLSPVFVQVCATRWQLTSFPTAAYPNSRRQGSVANSRSLTFADRQS